MKKIVCFLAVWSLLIGSMTYAQEAAVASDLMAVVDEYMAAWNAHDAAKAAEQFDDQVEYLDATVGTPQKGKADAQKNIIEAFINAAPDLKWERTGAPVIGEGAVAFEWSFTGTNTGDWSDGTKATGKSFSIIGLSIMRFRNGKIVYQGDFYDAYGFYKQLGLAQ